ncbi:glycosyltransferase family 4 protein [Thermodesulfobacteriota bacterium]
MAGNSNILMITGDFPPMKKGVGDYAFHISRSLHELGISVKVLTSLLANKTSNIVSDKLDVRREVIGWELKEVPKIIRELDSLAKNAIVNIQYYCPSTYRRGPMINLLPLIIRLLRPKCTIVVTIHGFREQSFMYRFRTLPMVRASHGIIYVDKSNRDLLIKYSGLQEDCLKFIPITSNILSVPCDGILRKNWRESMRIDQNKIIVAFFGAIGQPKGFDYLLKAIQLVRQRDGYPIILLAIGGFHSYKDIAYKKYIIRLIDELDLTSFLRIIQQPEPEDCSKLLHVSDIAVFPFVNGVSENSGSTLAALMHGLPTIVTNGPYCSRDFFEKYGAAVVPANETLKLANVISAVAGSKELREEMQKKASRLEIDLPWKRIALETLHFFERISSNR